MKTFLPIFSAALAAFSVWLTARIVSRRERWAKRTATAILAAMILYPLSAGPATWVIHHCSLSKPALRFVLRLYDPLEIASESMPGPVFDALNWWQEIFIDLGGPSQLRDQ